MPRTAACPHHVANAGLPHSDRLLEPTPAFDPAVDRLDAYAPPRQLPIPRFLGPRQLVPTRLLHGLEDGHAVQREGLKARSLPQLTPRRQRIRSGRGEAGVMDTPRRRLAQAAEAQGALDQEQVFQQGPLCLAARTRFLGHRVVGARDGALGAVRTTRGAADGGGLGPASAGALCRDQDGPSPPRRACQASTRREGASPVGRRVWRNTGRKP
jgi:hypothetical protein